MAKEKPVAPEELDALQTAKDQLLEEQAAEIERLKGLMAAKPAGAQGVTVDIDGETYEVRHALFLTLDGSPRRLSPAEIAAEPALVLDLYTQGSTAVTKL